MAALSVADFILDLYSIRLRERSETSPSQDVKWARAQQVNFGEKLHTVQQ